MCTLRYTPLSSPSRSTCTEVLASFCVPSSCSMNDPATISTPSSRAVERAQRTVGPSSVSAAARVGETRMALMRGGRPLKRWRYVGIFNDELMACAALVQVGPARQAFWALYMRGEDRMRERTHTLRRRGAVDLTRGAVRVRD